MARPKVRADAHSLAAKLAARGVNLAELPPGPDGWHSSFSLMRAVNQRMTTEARQARSVPAGPWGGQHPVAWALESGRITQRSAPEWRERYRDNPADTAATLGELAPVLAANAAGGIPVVSATPARNSYSYQNAVEELRVDHATAVARAEAAEPPPELFPGSGDYPRRRPRAASNRAR